MNIHSYFRDIFSSWQTGQIGGCAIIFGLVLLLSGCSSQSTKKEDDASDSSDNDFSGGVVSKKSPKGSNQKKTSGEPNIKSIAKVSKRLEIRPPVKDEFKEFVGINRIALSADGNRAIIRFNGDPNKIQIWDLQSQSKIQEFEDSGEALPVALSPQGDKAAIATALKGVVVKDSMTGAQLHQFIFNKDLRLGFMTDFRFTADGSMLIGSTTAGFLIGWNVNSGTQTFAKQAASEATKVTTLSPLVEQGNKVAYGTDSGFFHLWDLQVNKEIRESRDSIPGGYSVAALALTPDGKYWAATDKLGPIYVRKTANKEEVCRIRGMFPPRKVGISSILFLMDNRTLVYPGNKKGNLFLHDIHNNRRIQVLDAHEEFGIPEMTLTPNGRIMATCGRDGRLILWDVK